MSNKTLLDVDDSIIRNNLLLTERKSEEEEFNTLLRNLEKSEPPSMTFRPLPGACVKCRTETGEKVFLNICKTNEIPAPEDLTEQQFFDVLEQTEPTWSIPMSIGHEKYEEAKDGTKCLTYDIAINTKYFEKCQKQKVFWSFTIITIISGINEKHEKNIKSEFTVLQNRKVLGKLHDHRAQKREVRKPSEKKPLIEEIASSTKRPEVKKIQENEKLESTKTPYPEYIILRKPKEGKVEQLIGYFKLPNKLRIKDMRVDVCDDRIIVEAPRTNYLVDIFVPYELEQEKATATMDPNVNVLRLDIPVM